MNRREFLTQTGAAGIAAVGLLADGEAPAANSPNSSGNPTGIHSTERVSIIRDPSGAAIAAEPVVRGILQLTDALAARNIRAVFYDRIDQAPPGGPIILIAGCETQPVREILDRAGASIHKVAESLALVRGQAQGRPVLLATGHDSGGITYGLLELADRVMHSDHPISALNAGKPLIERAANPIRSVARLFTSEIEDKPWYYDRDFWRRYLPMLAAQRFNRFSLTFGIGYDFLSEVTDSYFHFAYPFLVHAPGYTVRARGLPDEEREKNLEMLRFISEEATAVGLHFQLGLWTHGYDWSRNRGVNYVIEGLSPENHAAYCRDALRTLLQTCPGIKGVTFRIHGESGVAEGTYEFWKTVFDGVGQCGRRVEIDMHAKGIDNAMIDLGLATGMPVNVSPKFWAEHLGLPYHQASIRALEMPPRGKQDAGFFAKSDGSRRFMRYGYGDLLTEDRKYGILFRIWPGTQRLLLWGDPAFAAGYGRAAGFCGSLGMEICEPLSFKGRKGSGLRGGRDGYAGPNLRPAGGDFEKYLYTYRLWGRLLYNPETSPDVWQRALKSDFGPAAAEAEAALANASRILPLVTTAHLPSAANNGYWPEMYTNMPIVDAKRPHPYGDTPTPKRFGAVSAIDPELFLSIDDFVQGIKLGGRRYNRISPMEVAKWLDDFAKQASHHLANAEKQVKDRNSPRFRRLAVDVAIQSGLGRFFAAKLRAGVLFAIYGLRGDRKALRDALAAYRHARETWAGLSAKARAVYAEDITFGRAAHLRGNWSDRLAAIDLDIADMERVLSNADQRAALGYDGENARELVERAMAAPLRPRYRLEHLPPRPFRRGQPVEIVCKLYRLGIASQDIEIRLHFRHVNQAEPYCVEEMELRENSCRAVIPGDYTNSPYPLMYYFDLRESVNRVALYPGFTADLTNQPYFVIRQARAVMEP